jgi:hypothetical protein
MLIATLIRCGAMPEEEATMGRRAYAASVAFVDEQVSATGGH